jgi:hypothetical protein
MDEKPSFQPPAASVPTTQPAVVPNAAPHPLVTSSPVALSSAGSSVGTGDVGRPDLKSLPFRTEHLFAANPSAASLSAAQQQLQQHFLMSKQKQQEKKLLQQQQRAAKAAKVNTSPRKRQTSPSNSKSPKKRRKRTICELTKKIIELLQVRGQLTLKELVTELKADQRILSILDVLRTTPLVNMMRRINGGGKQLEDERFYIYRNGETLPESVSLDNFTEQIEREEEIVKACEQRLEILKVANETSLFAKVCPMETYQKILDLQPEAAEDPLYRGLFTSDIMSP